MDPIKEAIQALGVEQIRAAGGIVHSDGNIFFTSLDQLQSAVRAALAAQQAGVQVPEALVKWANSPELVETNNKWGRGYEDARAWVHVQLSCAAAPEAPAQAAGEPVAWRWVPSKTWGGYVVTTNHGEALMAAEHVSVEPLYLHPPTTPPAQASDAEDAARDTARLNYLQNAIATVEILPDRKGNWRFRVGGRNDAVSLDLRSAIDTARKGEQP